MNRRELLRRGAELTTLSLLPMGTLAKGALSDRILVAVELSGVSALMLGEAGRMLL